MQVELKKLDDTQVQLTIAASEDELAPYKEQILKKLARDVKLPGFRAGKAPLNLIEKNLDQNQLQTEFLDTVLTDLYAVAIKKQMIRPVTRPDVAIKKFVPFSALEFEVTTHIIGKIEVGKYRGLTKVKPEASVTVKDVDEVVKSLQIRLAEKNEVERAAKKDDEVWIDFKGEDTKGKPVKGAEGKDYPLVIGSNTFIPGFEDNVLGMSPGDKNTFTITFPKDYGVNALASKKVVFHVTANKVKEVVMPKLDDEFAAKAGPFTNLKDLKADIKKQIAIERENEQTRIVQNNLVDQVVSKSKLTIPKPLIEQQVVHELDELKRNLTYRGQTYQEYLEAEGKSEEAFIEEVIEPRAILQIKTSLVLAEIAEIEKLSVSPEELEIRMQLLKGQYTDQTMQADLAKPEVRRDIASRMLSERVVNLMSDTAV